MREAEGRGRKAMTGRIFIRAFMLDVEDALRLYFAPLRAVIAEFRRAVAPPK
jgi:hypothetical protein